MSNSTRFLQVPHVEYMSGGQLGTSGQEINSSFIILDWTLRGRRVNNFLNRKATHNTHSNIHCCINIWYGLIGWTWSTELCSCLACFYFILEVFLQNTSQYLYFIVVYWHYCGTCAPLSKVFTVQHYQTALLRRGQWVLNSFMNENSWYLIEKRNYRNGEESSRRMIDRKG